MTVSSDVLPSLSCMYPGAMLTIASPRFHRVPFPSAAFGPLAQYVVIIGIGAHWAWNKGAAQDQLNQFRGAGCAPRV